MEDKKIPVGVLAPQDPHGAGQEHPLVPYAEIEEDQVKEPQGLEEGRSHEQRQECQTEA